MAKKARKAVASKARRAKTSTGKKRPAAKARRKVAMPRKAKSVAKGKRAGKRIAKQPEGLLQKVAGAVEAVLDTLTDAEQLHRKLEPEISREPE